MSEQGLQRIIGRYDQGLPGALVMVFAAMHGNEHAGVEALQEVFRLLYEEKKIKPEFTFHGRLLGLIGNWQAFATGQRFIDRDLNRLWTPVNLLRIRQTAPADLRNEDRELRDLFDLIQHELLDAKAEALILLDLHTTSADGGIFCIPGDDPQSLRMAKQLHAPVILGMLDGIEGTLLHFASGNHLEFGGFPRHTVGVAFESGQHDDPLSVSRAIAGIINCLRAGGNIHPDDVDTRHDTLLMSYSAGLPKVTRLRHAHPVRPGDAFRMRPGYRNFQPIQAGEHLADDVTGPIRAPQDGRILMPLYQEQGADGFFVVEDVG